MSTIQRNRKTGGTNEFHTEWELGFTEVKASEVDDDFNTLFTAWNALGLIVSVGSDPPLSPAQGQLWWRNDPDGNLFIFYDDGNSAQWVPAVPVSTPNLILTLMESVKELTTRIAALERST